MRLKTFHFILIWYQSLQTILTCLDHQIDSTLKVFSRFLEILLLGLSLSQLILKVFPFLHEVEEHDYPCLAEERSKLFELGDIILSESTEQHEAQMH